MQEYQVRENDTLESIARRFQIPIFRILEQNNLTDIYELVPGTILQIPITNVSAFEIYKIQQGDTLYSLAQRYNTDAKILMLLNGLETNAYLYVGENILVPKSGIKLYLTEYGDSIQKIASLNDINPNDILVYNDRVYLLPEQIIAYQQI